MTHDQEGPDGIEEFVAQFTKIPLDQATRIYQAGQPWPLNLSPEFEELVVREAESNSVKVETAANALDGLLQIECDALDQRLNKMIAEGQCPSIPELEHHPLFVSVDSYVKQVADTTGESIADVHRVFLAVYSYRSRQPKSEPEG